MDVSEGSSDRRRSRKWARAAGVAQQSVAKRRGSSPLRRTLFFLAGSMLLWMMFSLVACSGQRIAAKGPSRPQSAWTGDEADLFDDGIDLGAVPMGAEPVRPD